MDDEKEINAMADILNSRFSVKAQARELQKHGYGDKKQAGKEVLESLKRSFGRRKFKRRERLIIEETIEEHINELYGKGGADD
ncbi:MAG: hypothetical protein K2L42_03175 [Clostridia bacterium]|nr:hypothetical protein [Clostridia bacterium]